MRPVVTDQVAWSVGQSVSLSVCRSVCHTSEPYKNGCTDRYAVWIEEPGGPKEPRVRWGSRCSHVKGQFWGERGILL